MDALGVRDELTEGARALERGDWPVARTAFETVLQAGESAEALDGLGLALWFLGRVGEGIAARERAFDAYVRVRQCDQAAHMAVGVSHQHLTAGRASAARGWLERAERALEGLDACAGRGWVAVERARHAGNIEERIDHARSAMQIARAFRADDLEVFALSVLGRAEVSAGRRTEGVRLLEEAMAAASAGRVRNVHTLAEAYCNLITACTNAGDWELATEWWRWSTTSPARTRPHRCSAPAERSTPTCCSQPAAGRRRSARSRARYVPQIGAPAVASLAELRVRQGRLHDAERLLAGREEHASALRALALLRIAQNEPDAAVALLERGLSSTEGDAMRATQLLAPLVDARLARGDLGAARTAADELVALAELSGIRLVGARAQLAIARIANAAGRPADAMGPAGRALTAFSALAMPLDAGEARIELARAAASESPAVAADEARTALATFRELGALRAMDAAAGLLRDLGGAAGARPRATGELTAREREVLELIAQGMSNAAIARTLVISDKTAGHHVSRILMKLGVRNRAEAAAHAVRSADAKIGSQ
ncbi:MAG: LuxR C-terminal-related transcriptional regulator [Solirubrobacteraceae bacterium]